MKINLDIKTILILVLLGVSVFFGFKWFFTYGENKRYKGDLKDLKESYKELDRYRDSLRSEIKKIEKEYDKIKKEDDILKNRIETLESDILKTKDKANASSKELEKLIKENNERMKEIDKLKNMPNDKTDDELLDSFKNNLKP